MFDLVKPAVPVTEHRGYEARFRGGQRHCSRFPHNISAPVQYDPVIKRRLVYLRQRQLQPIAHTAEILSDLFGVKLSAGSVQSSNAQDDQTLASAVKRIAVAVSTASVVHFDETRQSGWTYGCIRRARPCSPGMARMTSAARSRWTPAGHAGDRFKSRHDDRPSFAS